MTKKIVLSNKLRNLKHLTYFILKDVVPVIIDPEDFERIAKYNWHLTIRSNGILDVASTCEELRQKYDKNCIYLREVIFGMHETDKVIDHINRNPLDNRKQNLRLVSRWCDTVNRAKAVGTSSIYKGVVKIKTKTKENHNIPNKNYFKAEIKVRDEKIYLGKFSSEIEAAIAFNEATKEYNGEYGDLNIIDCYEFGSLLFEKNQIISDLKNKLTKIRELTRHTFDLDQEALEGL